MRLLTSCRLVLPLALLALQTVRAQDTPPAPIEGAKIIIAGDTEGVAPIFSAISAAPGSSTFYSFNSMGSGPADLRSLLYDGNVQQELELIDDQKVAIKKLQAEFSKRSQDLMKRSFTGGPVDGLTVENLRERQKALREEFEEKLADTLLPHQIKRLKEVALHTQLQRQGTAGALGTKQLAEALDISDEQLERIQKTATAAKKRLEEQIAALRKQAQQEVLDELTPTQKQKLKDLLGDDFTPRATRRLSLPNGAAPIRKVTPKQ